MVRPKIPKSLEKRLMYESAFVCTICQEPGCQIHHIDQDHSNNNEDNLIVLCVKHHDEAHTKRQLSKNLDSSALKKAKKNWCKQVANKRALVATTFGQKALQGEDSFLSVGIAWGYINHKRITQIANPNRLTSEAKRNFDYCKARGLLDQSGVVIRPTGLVPAKSVVHGTIYDWFEYGDDQRVHLAYTALVDQVAANHKVLHLEAPMWTKSAIREMAQPGTLLYLNKALYFKSVSTTKTNEHRRCRTFKRNIEMEFFVDTQDMFGVTSISVSFSGHKSCASLVQLKSIEETNDGKLVLHCTPIALGVGFNEFQPNT